MTRSELGILKFLLQSMKDSYLSHKQKYDSDLANDNVTNITWYESGATNALKPEVEKFESFVKDMEVKIK